MSKAPAFQFYTGDWSKDVELHMMSFQSRGIWIEMLMCMWDSSDRGKLTGTREQLCRLIGCNLQEINQAIQELSVTKTADVTECNDLVTVINRRMHREERERKLTRSRVNKHRVTVEKRICNADVTPPSSTSSSTSVKEKVIKEKISFEENQFKNIPADLTAKWKSIAPAISIPNEIAKAEAWVMSNPKLTKSNWSRFLTNWMVRAQDSARRENANTNNGNGQYRQNFKPSYRGGQRQPADIPQDVLADIAAINRLQAQKKTPGAGGENTG